MPFWPVNQRMPRVSNAAVLRLAFGRLAGSGKRLTSEVVGSTRRMAFRPPSVTHAAPSGPTITPCGAEPLPSLIWRVSPVAGLSLPSSPLRCAVYQTVPSGAGATSCGPEPAGTAYSCTVTLAAGIAVPALAFVGIVGVDPEAAPTTRVAFGIALAADAATWVGAVVADAAEGARVRAETDEVGAGVLVG